MSLITRRDIFALALLGLCSPAFAQDSRNGYYTNPAIGTLQPVTAKSGMVVAQERIAAEIGRDVLARGGNAIGRGSRHRFRDGRDLSACRKYRWRWLHDCSLGEQR